MMQDKVTAIMNVARGKDVQDVRKPFIVDDGQVVQWYELSEDAFFMYYVCHVDDGQNLADRNNQYKASTEKARDIAQHYWDAPLPSIHVMPSIEQATKMHRCIMDYVSRQKSR